MTGEEARKFILDRTVDGREGFFCLTSNLDYHPDAIRKMYRDKGCVEKLFSSMKSDIGIRPTGLDGRRGLQCAAQGFLAQALIAMQKLTLTIKRRGLEGTEMILSNFSHMNTAILRTFGVIPEDVRCE